MAIRIERSGGNIISSTNTDGDISIAPDGTGTIELAADTNVTGAISATDDVTTSKSGALTIKATSSLNTSYARVKLENDAAAAVSLYMLGSTYAGTISGNAAAGAAWVNSDSKMFISGVDDTIITRNGTVKIRATSSGVDMHGTISATTGITVATGQDVLDAHDAGTYTATLTCSTSGTITLDSASNTLGYNRIGDLCFVSGRLRVDSVSSPTGSVSLNLPFTSANYTEYGAATFAAVGVSGAVSNNINEFALNINEAASTAELDTMAGTTYVGGAPQMQAGTIIRVGFCYVVA